ncbi:MAG: YcaO-like family protein [Pseudomonadota bacterium]
MQERRDAPEETLRRIEPSFDRIGVTRLADLTGLDTIGMPVFAAHRPNARSLSVTQGKGPTSADAKTSAVMEAVELACAEAPRLPLRLAASSDLDGSVIDLDRLPKVEGANALDTRCLWTEARTLSDDEPVWVPYELVHMDYTLPLPPRLGGFHMTSTGLASGNTAEEAVTQALAEVIERDAVTLWRLSGEPASQTRIDPKTVNDPVGTELLAAFRAAEVGCAIWEITTDLGIPAFFATIVDQASRQSRGLHAASGSGCHPVRGIALRRALTEAAQSRLTLISGARDDRSRDHYREMRNTSAIEAQRDEILHGDATQSFADGASHAVATPTDCQRAMLDAFTAAGVGPAVSVDLSWPELPAAVVRVIVPGLEGSADAPGYQPGQRALARGVT